MRIKFAVAVVATICPVGYLLSAPDWVDVTQVPYSAACDWNDWTQTGTDDHVAIQSALNAARNVYIPRDCYIGTSKLVFGNIAYATIEGASQMAAKLVSASTSLPTIEVVAATPGLTIKNLGFSKPTSVTAAFGADGIKYLGYVDHPVIMNVDITRHYVGINASSTAYGKITESYIHSNVSHGILFANPTIINAYQWYVSNTLVETNGGVAAYVTPGSNSALGPGSSQGTWDNFRTFNNAGGGMVFQGTSAVPIEGVRVLNSYLGKDGGTAEIVLDTYNSYPHIIANTYIELNTSGPCLWATPNNKDITVSSSIFKYCFQDGISNEANYMMLLGVAVNNSGRHSVANGGDIVITGSDLTRPGSGTRVNNIGGTVTQFGNRP